MVKTVCLILITAFFSLSHIAAQENSTGQTMPLFQSDEILKLVLEADFKTVFSVKDDSTYFPAKIKLTDNDGQEKTIDIRIRTRGKTRRKKEICTFYPLRLNFPKKETINTPFEGQNAIKLVTHCDKAKHYEQNTVEEYLIYKAYNVLTDSSFKVRPAMITYIFTGGKADTIRKFAFFVEREKHMTERLHGIELEAEKYDPERLNPAPACLMDMFQYMIGNTDYSCLEQHNIILVSDSTRQFSPVPVPYDFDWSGLISASYAVPNPVIGTDHVSERVYRGFKKERSIVYSTIELFNARKQEIYQEFENFELLGMNEKEKIYNYLDGFYKIINNDQRVQTVFFDNAREVDRE